MVLVWVAPLVHFLEKGMTEMEKIIIKKFIDKKILLFYEHFVDDTLISVK